MGRTVQYMNWMNKLEKKIGRYAIPNISLYLIIAYVVGQVLYYTPLSGILNWFSFAPQLIFRGQIWRLVTWIFIPIPTNMFLALIFMFLFPCIKFHFCFKCSECFLFPNKRSASDICTDSCNTNSAVGEVLLSPVYHPRKLRHKEAH